MQECINENHENDQRKKSTPESSQKVTPDVKTEYQGQISTPRVRERIPSLNQFLESTSNQGSEAALERKTRNPRTTVPHSPTRHGNMKPCPTT